jgi:hypothetical protein
VPVVGDPHAIGRSPELTVMIPPFGERLRRVEQQVHEDLRQPEARQ